MAHAISTTSCEIPPGKHIRALEDYLSGRMGGMIFTFGIDVLHALDEEGPGAMRKICLNDSLCYASFDCLDLAR